MLLEQVRCETVRVGVRAPLGVREHIHLAMRLLERLLNLVRVQPRAPADDFVHVAPNRMPECDRGLGPQFLHRFEIDVHQLAVEPDAGGVLLPVCKHPGKPPGQHADQRMIEIPLGPHRERPALLLQERRRLSMRSRCAGSMRWMSLAAA